MNDDIERVLGSARLIAAGLFTEARKVARLSNQVLVDGGLLTALLDLEKTVRDAGKNALPTRDYKDLIDRGLTTYSGKKTLVRRNDAGEVFRALRRVQTARGAAK